MTQTHLAPELEALIEAPLSVEEFDRRLPMTDEELEANLELIRWFTRRYPTVKERLAYARRTYAQWARPTQLVKRSA